MPLVDARLEPSPELPEPDDAEPPPALAEVETTVLDEEGVDDNDEEDEEDDDPLPPEEPPDDDPELDDPLSLRRPLLPPLLPRIPPSRPPPDRLPRSCGVTIETYLSAPVVPLRRIVRSMLPFHADAVATTTGSVV